MYSYHHSQFRPALYMRSARLLSLFFVLAILWGALHAASAKAADTVWSLQNEARRSYLRYYAPIIMKRANEKASKYWGVDWVTNFDYDRDGNFSTNRRNWEQGVAAYVANPKDPKFAAWKIRPTLYAALLEFQEGSGKSVLLLYHVYHAKEDGSIHDWERIEIRVDNVDGTPGAAAERIRYVTVTEHSTHNARLISSTDLNFMSSTDATGRHPIIYQGEWTDTDKHPRKNELRFVMTPWNAIDTAVKKCPANTTCKAEVTITGEKNPESVHYVFVPEDDAKAVAYWGASALSSDNASTKASKTNKTVNTWNQVPRLTYELQDLADILPTHADTVACGGVAARENGWGPFSTHWQTDNDTVKIQMDEGIYSETGVLLVPPSSYCNNLLTYYRYSKDVLGRDDAQGYPYKHWFWGAYVTDHEGHTDEIFAGTPFIDPISGGTKVRNCPNGIGKFWCQHDYYVHTGQPGSEGKDGNPPYKDDGRWLPLGWHLPQNGGFDGRWVQLFDDRF